MIDKDKVIQLARDSGLAQTALYVGETEPHLVIEGHYNYHDEIMAFAQAIYRQGLEDAAKVCDTHMVDDMLAGVFISESCATMIRSLKESTNV